MLSLLNRGTSTHRQHDNHTPDLHMHGKLKQVSAHLQTHTYTHTCKGVAQTRHNGGHTSAHAHTLDRQAADSVSTGSPSTCPHGAEGSAWLRAACERGCTPVPLGHLGVLWVGPWRETLSAA